MRGRPACARAVWLAGIAAIMPVAALCWPGPAASAQTPGAFAPPSEPMVLTRTLRRALPGGAEVRTQRQYEVRFVRDGTAYRIDGRLIAVAVEAPPALRALAALEEGRRDTGMFPMRLDADGRLLPRDDPRHGDSVARAGHAAVREIEELPLAGAEADRARSFARYFEQRSVRTPWPEDLFHPAPGRREERRAIPMPDGARGTVEVAVSAERRPATGLLSRFERTVTTEIADHRRVTDEIWTLEPRR